MSATGGVVGVPVADTDDAELVGVRRALVVVFAAPEANDNGNIDVLATQVFDAVGALRVLMSIGCPEASFERP